MEPAERTILSEEGTKDGEGMTLGMEQRIVYRGEAGPGSLWRKIALEMTMGGLIIPVSVGVCRVKSLSIN